MNIHPPYVAVCQILAPLLKFTLPPVSLLWAAPFCILCSFYTICICPYIFPSWKEFPKEWRQGITGDKCLEVKWSEIAQSCPTLCDRMDCSLPGSSVHGIFQARILEWVAISFSRGSSRLRDRTQVSLPVGRHFTVWATREAMLRGIHNTFVSKHSAHLCLTLHGPMDCNPPGSSARGIFWVKTLEWVAISPSRWSPQLRDQICFSCISRWILYPQATWQAFVLRQGRFKYILGRGLIK